MNPLILFSTDPENSNESLPVLKNPLGTSFPSPEGSILIQLEVENPILKRIFRVQDLWKSRRIGLLSRIHP